MPSRLTWAKLIETFRNSPEGVLRGHSYCEPDGELLYDGIKIGEELLFNIPTLGDELTSF